MSSEPRARYGAFARTIALALLALGASSLAAHAYHRHHRIAYSGAVSATAPEKDAALVEDGATGKVLYARNADALRHPASLTKMMTLYLLFDALRDGRVNLGTMLNVSAHAAAQKPTNLHLSAGDQINVDTAIKAIVVRSANDVAVTIAENLGGTELHFAELMTEKAKVLGMHSTYYHNASGLPDALQITTASDLAILARHLGYDYPQYFHYFSTPSFVFRGVYYPTHDNLIGRYDGADGIKTGYTGASGFNLVSSVVRGGMHIIGVMMGGRTAHMRDRAMVAMLDSTFSQISLNPTMVASARVPWQSTTLALNTTAPIEINAAGVPQQAPATIGTSSSPVPTQPQSTGPTLAMVAPTTLPGDADDEDAAESKTNEGNLDLGPRVMVQPLPPQAPPKPTPAPPAAAPKSQPVVAVAVVIKPRMKPAMFDETAPGMKPQVVATLITPRLKPELRVAEAEIGEGDISYERAPPITPAPKPNLRLANVNPAPPAAAAFNGSWMIQIGAYANQTLARAQLASYAEKSMDVLGQAERVVAPFQSVDGKTVYRARFGPFAEREARQVCNRLTQRGQTCFAAVATR